MKSTDSDEQMQVDECGAIIGISVVVGATSVNGLDLSTEVGNSSPGQR